MNKDDDPPIDEETFAELEKIVWQELSGRSDSKPKVKGKTMNHENLQHQILYDIYDIRKHIITKIKKEGPPSSGALNHLKRLMGMNFSHEKSRCDNEAICNIQNREIREERFKEINARINRWKKELEDMGGFNQKAFCKKHNLDKETYDSDITNQGKQLKKLIKLANERILEIWEEEISAIENKFKTAGISRAQKSILKASIKRTNKGKRYQDKIREFVEAQHLAYGFKAKQIIPKLKMENFHYQENGKKYSDDTLRKHINTILKNCPCTKCSKKRKTK